MKLIKMTLNNFKGIKEFTFEPNGLSVNVFGDNGAGKTTLYDAFLWLLFGKDSTGRADFEIKPLLKTGEPVHMLDHSVEATVDHDARFTTLKRVYKEKWVRKRGAAEAEFSGHETLYFIDDVPKKESEYKAGVASLINEKLFRLITDPMFFNQMPWKERRDMMLQLVDEVTDEEVIAKDPVFEKLANHLKTKSPEEIKAMAQSQRKQINDSIKMIPTRIDEVTRGLTELPEEDFDALAHKLANLKDELVILRSKESAVDTLKAKKIADIQRIIDTNKQQLDANRRIEQEQHREYEHAKQELEMIRSMIEAKSDVIRQKAEYIENLADDAAKREEEIEALGNQWKTLKKSEFPMDYSDVECPTCGQILPEEQKLSVIHEKKVAFEADKEKMLAQITASGLALKAKISQLKEQIQANQEAMKATTEDLEASKEKASQLLDWIENHKVRSFESDNAMIQRVIDEKTALLFAVSNETNEVELSVQYDAKNQLEAEIERISTILAERSVILRAQSRIEELKAEESKLAGELMKAEALLFAIEKFIAEKANLCEEKLNTLFKTVKFKLFERSINGGISDTFVTLINGVPFPDANTASQINVGLEIIEKFCEIHQTSAPIFVDHRESVTRLYKSSSQIIGLIARINPSGKKELTMEAYS